MTAHRPDARRRGGGPGLLPVLAAAVLAAACEETAAPLSAPPLIEAAPPRGEVVPGPVAAAPAADTGPLPAALAPAAPGNADPSPAPPAPSAAAAPAARPPALNDDPARLLHLDPAALRSLLGAPDFVRRDGPARIWRYRHGGCLLDLILYAEPGDAASFAVRYVEARTPEAETAPSQRCFRALLLARADQRVLAR